MLRKSKIEKKRARKCGRPGDVPEGKKPTHRTTGGALQKGQEKKMVTCREKICASASMNGAKVQLRKYGKCIQIQLA